MNDILKYKDFYATIHFNSDDEVFFGKIEGINDLVSFEGTSVASLKKSFKEAAEDYIETCKQFGKAPEKSYKGSFNVRVSSQLHKEAALAASHKKISLNQFIQAALSYAIKHQETIIKEQ